LKTQTPNNMKRIATIFVLLLTTISFIAQPPVAVNDTASSKLGEYITVKVTENDYSPEGLSFKIFQAYASHSFTDSTITYFFEYEKYYNLNNKYLQFSYMIIDENGQAGSESGASVFIDLNNQNYYDTLDIGNIKTVIYAYNNHFWNNNDDKSFYEFPKGSRKHTIFNQAIWVGGQDGNGQLKLAAERYRQQGLDFWTGPISVDGFDLSIDTLTVVDWHYVWKLSTEEIIYHKFHFNDPGYEPIKNIKTWPAHGDIELNQNQYLAPFIDVDGDSLYDPYAGDYPLIRGDQCIFFIFNDFRSHTETEGEKIGLEIHGMAYAFDTPGNQPMTNSVFISYKIFNRSSETLNNTFVGLFCDFDIGYARDDYVGCDISRGAYYGYNGEEVDGDGQPDAYGENPPAQGIVILGGPYLDPNGEDDPDGGCDESITGVGFGDNIIDNERYGMTKFLYFNNDASIQGDPVVAEDYFSYMKGIWKDGTSMEYGGNGHISSGAYGPACNFMFPGLSDPCYWGTNGEEPYGPVDWTEESAGNEPNDRRGWSVMGPFTFQPNSMHKVDLAFVSARGDDGPLSSVTLLKEYIDVVKQAYYEDTDYFGYQWLGDEEWKAENQSLNIFPNPANDKIWIDNKFEGQTIKFAIYDAFGRLVNEGQLSNSGELRISINELKTGIYIIKITDQNKMYSAKILKN